MVVVEGSIFDPPPQLCVRVCGGRDEGDALFQNIFFPIEH